jgi:hypothetical protein
VKKTVGEEKSLVVSSILPSNSFLNNRPVKVEEITAREDPYHRRGVFLKRGSASPGKIGGLTGGRVHATRPTKLPRARADWVAVGRPSEEHTMSRTDTLSARIHRLEKLSRDLTEQAAVFEEGNDLLDGDERRNYVASILEAVGDLAAARDLLASVRVRLAGLKIPVG